MCTSLQWFESFLNGRGQKVDIIIIINNQPTDKVQRPVGCNTMKTGLSSSTYPGLYGI